MTKATVFIPIKQEVYETFHHLMQQMNSAQKVDVKQAGNAVAGFANNIMDAVFGNMIHHLQAEGHLGSNVEDAKSTIKEVCNAFDKYIPWMFGKFSGERLKPFIEYFYNLIHQHEGTFYVHYPLSAPTAHAVQQMRDKLAAQQVPSPKHMIDVLVQSIEDGLTHLIIKPKALLKFNLIVNKTLDGVIAVTSKFAYRQLYKMSESMKDSAMHSMTTYLLDFVKAHGKLD